MCQPPSTQGDCSEHQNSETNCPDIDGSSPLINEGDIFQHWAGHPGAPDVSVQSREVTMKAWRGSEAPPTKVLDILNSVSGVTTCRTEYMAKWYWTNYDGEDRLRDEIQSSHRYKIITPIGTLAEWKVYAQHNIHEYNYPNYDNVFGEFYSESQTSWRRTIAGVYSKKAMVQLFTVEALKHKTHKPCGYYRFIMYWVPCCYFTPCPDDYDIYEYAQVFEVLASAGLVDDAETQDPRLLSRNTDLETAIKLMHTQYVANCPVPPEDELIDYSITAELRE